MKTAFRVSASAMVGTARSEGLPEKDFRWVLIVAIIPIAPEAASRTRRAWFGTLGDASAWLRVQNGWYQLAGYHAIKNRGFDYDRPWLGPGVTGPRASPGHAGAGLPGAGAALALTA